jgi:hypothetical protein
MYKRGDSWYSDFWYQGERYTESHGPVTKSVAKEKDIKYQADVANGDYTKLKDNPLFETALDDHLKWSKAHNAPRTWSSKVDITKKLKPFFGGKRIRYHL